MKNEQMKNDCNFGKVPVEVYNFVDLYKISCTQYVGWYQKIGNVLRVFAYRYTKRRGLEIHEVIRMSPDEEGLIFRDMYLTGMSGWRVVYHPERKKSQSWYGYTYYDYDVNDFGKWSWYDEIGIHYPVINSDILKETEFRFCGWSEEVGMNLVEYLRLWKEHPEVEYFGKIGLNPRKSLLKKVKKDKGFANFLWKNRDVDFRYYGPSEIIYAYDNKMDLDVAKEILEERRRANQLCSKFVAIKGLDVNKVKILNYCEENGINRAYSDYLDALVGLGYDLNDTKNLFPKNFRRMHDLRIQEWDSKKAKMKEEERRKFEARFREVSEELKRFEVSDGMYCVIIPEKVKDLEKEGYVLNHCVGKMGYDKKMVDKISFIAFLRQNKAPESPYVTIEYGIKDKKILQIYGEHDSNPGKEVMDWAKKWEKMVKKEMVV